MQGLYQGISVAFMAGRDFRVKRFVLTTSVRLPPIENGESNNGVEQTRSLWPDFQNSASELLQNIAPFF